MEKKTVTIPDISCGHCLMAVKREAGEVPGVASVEGDATTKEVTFEFDAPETWAKIEEALKDAGYPPKVML